MGRSVSGSGSNNQFLTTVSPVGFTAGDLIYNTPQGIGPITTSPTGTATFAASSTAPYAPTGSPTQAGLLKYVEPYGGITTAQGVATLTNGNILIAYGRRYNATASADVYFKVVDTSDNVVVAETLVSAIQGINSGTPVGALALPNGTFAVIWIGNSAGTQRLFTAIYNNNGTVVTAATADTSVAASGSIPQLAFAARSDSSFVVAFTNSSQVPVYRVYSSTGATVYSGTWASGFGNAGNNSILSAVVRSDDSFVLAASDPVGTSNVYYIILSATNTTLANTSFGAPGFVFGHKAILQPTDVVRFVFFCSNGIFTRTLTGTTLGSQVTLRSLTFSQYNGLSCGTINGSGDFIVTFSVNPNTYANNTTYSNTKLMYEVFDAAGTSLAGPIRLKAMNNYSQGAMANILVVGSEIRIYKSSTTQASGQHMFYPRGIYYARINSTTYAANPFSTLPITLPSITASVGAYVKSASTINSAVFYPATTSTNNITVGPSTSTASTQLLSQTNVTAFSTLSPNVVTLANGNIAVIWQQNGSGNGVYYSVFNAQGVLQTTVTVQATVSSAWYLGTKIIQTSNGNIVAFYRDGNVIYFRIYSSSNVLLNSGNLSYSVYGDTPVWSVSPLGQNGYFVIGTINNSQQLGYAVFNTTGTQVANGNEPNGYTFYSGNVVGFRSGDFVIYGGSNSTGQNNGYVYGRVSDTSYSFMYGGFTISQGWSPYYVNGSVSLTPDDIAILYGFDGSASIQSVAVTPEWPNSSTLFYRSASGNIYTSSSGGSLSIGVTSNGDPVATTFTAIPNFYTNTQAGSSIVSYNYTAAQVSLGGDSANDANSGLSISPYVGDAVVMSYRGAAGATRIVIYYGASSTFSVTLTAGVTQSIPIPLSYAARTAFMGVALTNCSVGGAGVIQTRGTALVSTSYPSMTNSSFDFRNNTTYGVAGTVSGRIVNIEG